MSTWTDDVIKQLDRWHEYCYIQSGIFKIASSDSNQMHSWLGIPSLICEGVAGTIIFTTLDGNDNCDDESAFTISKIVSACLVVISIILGSIREYKRYDKQSSLFFKIHEKYIEICRYIEQEIALHPDERKSPSEFMESVRNKMTLVSNEQEKAISKMGEKTSKKIADRFISHEHAKIKTRKTLLKCVPTKESTTHIDMLNNDEKNNTENTVMADDYNGTLMLQKKRRELERIQLERLFQ